MLFNSLIFILFLTVVIPTYYCLSTRWQNIFLILASYVFYSYWDYRFLSLIMISTCINYYLALRIQSAHSDRLKRLFLIISLSCNLGFLGFFKYFNFFINSFSTLTQSFGFGPFTNSLHIILPLGISFYTFQIMAYIIDVYRGKQSATTDFISFALYVSYFPQLVAGPIERSQHLLPAIQSKRIVTREQITAGVQLILIGFVKKIAIADAVAPHVNMFFTKPQQFSSLDLLCGMYLFALQIYGDFSGYSDIARGVSKLMGIELMINFKQPYLSQSISEFWRRWHISLSSWLRDYLYIPLGGNRKGTLATYRNLFITMFLGGLWHGAAWVFVFWGCLHGIYLAVHRFFRNSIIKSSFPSESQNFIVKAIKILITFHLVCFAWIFFRAPNFATAYSYISTLVSFSSLWFTDSSLLMLTVFYVLFVLAIDLPSYISDRELLLSDQSPWVWRGLVYALLIITLSFIGESHVQPFIYFQF